MLSRLYGDIISYNALLNACDKGQQWILALNILETMSNESVLADVGSSQFSVGWGLVMQMHRIHWKNGGGGGSMLGKSVKHTWIL